MLSLTDLTSQAKAKQMMKLNYIDNIKDKEELNKAEPNLTIDAQGALYFGCDAHCSPNQLTEALLLQLRDAGVQFISNAAVNGFIIKGKRVTGVKYDQGSLEADEVVVATGSWSRGVLSELDISIDKDTVLKIKKNNRYKI